MRRAGPAKWASCRPTIVVKVRVAGPRPPCRTSRTAPVTPSKAICGCAWERPCGSANTAVTTAWASRGLTIESRSRGSGTRATASRTIGPMGARVPGSPAAARGAGICPLSAKKVCASPL